MICGMLSEGKNALFRYIIIYQYVVMFRIMHCTSIKYTINYGCHTWYKVYSYSSNWDQFSVTIHPGLGHARFQGESLNLPLVFGHNHFNLCSEVYKLRSRSTCCIWLISRALS